MRKLLERSARQYRSSKEIDTMKATLPAKLLSQPASDLMTKEVHFIHTADSIIETFQKFNPERHSFYPVVDSLSKKLKGVIAHEELYDFVQLNGLEDSATIQSINCCPLPAVCQATSIADCLETMIRGGSNKLLVLDERETLQGILSIRDVLAAAVESKLAVILE
jgi:CBS domain-containing protein